MSRAVITAGWDDVPHLSQQQKDELLASLPPHQREARSKGVPTMGAGAIYPILEGDIICDPFEIPKHWALAYGMDVGWKCTASVWGALDRDSDVLYLYSEHYRGQAEPSIHAESIKGRGDWIKGAIDPASRASGQKDGENLMDTYESLGLNLTKADNAVEAGILEVYQRLSSGKLKVFSTLQNWLKEYRIYRRDEKGKIVKQNDHIMDATRYLVMTGLSIASTKPMPIDLSRSTDWRTM